MKNISYKLALLILILFTLTFLSMPTVVAEENLVIDLEEDEDEIKVVQRGENLPVLKLLGSNNRHDDDPNEAYIEQIGDRNFASINQQGTGNFADIFQLGDKNEAYIEQKGNGNWAKIKQEANDCFAEIIQEGNELAAKIYQDEDGENEIIQKGNNLSVSTNIFGSADSVRIEQVGNNMNLNMDSLFAN